MRAGLSTAYGSSIKSSCSWIAFCSEHPGPQGFWHQRSGEGTAGFLLGGLGEVTGSGQDPEAAASFPQYFLALHVTEGSGVRLTVTSS